MNLQDYNKVSLIKNIFFILLIVTVCVFSFISMFYQSGNQFKPKHTKTQQQLEDEQNQQMMMSIIILST